MSITGAVLLFLAGAAAGFVNVNAGGGSLLTIPLLMILGGLPASAANGTNRVAMLIENVVAMKNFRRHGFRDVRRGLKLGLTAAAGAVAGSLIALEVPDEAFRIILSVVMALAVSVILRPMRGSGCRGSEDGSPRRPRLQVIMFFFVGLYGGFIQAGTGYLAIFALSTVGGLSLVRANSLKIIVISLYLLPSLGVFVLAGEVRWLPALVLSGGTSLGGWFGTSFAVIKGERWIRAVLALAVAAMAGRLLGLF